MKRLLIIVALLTAPGCSTPSPLNSLPLFSTGGLDPGDIRSSRGAMSGPDGPGSAVKMPFNW